MNDINLEEIEKKISDFHQEHLLLMKDEFQEKGILEEELKKIANIDFNFMNKLYENALKKEKIDQTIEIEPVNYVDKSKMSYKEKEELKNRGKLLIKEGKLAVVTMAGGQGTRLGHNAPKGTYDFGIGKSLFEIFCENLKSTFKEIGIYTYWYIMTSPENYSETVEFFEKNNYFNYPKNYIKFFVQSVLPMMGEDGKILLDTEGKIKFAADGHGGTLYALKNAGILDEMNRNGIKYVFISGVDNCLSNPTDTLFVGFADKTEADIVVKSIEKIDPKENVGVFCKKNGKVGVIEYSEISDEMANIKDDYGSLVYGDSNALLHIFSLDILNKLIDDPIPYHTAHKKADYMNLNKEIVRAEKPNAFKFEQFIFDAFEKVDNIQILRVQREDEFAPLKNKEGQDSPKTAKKLYLDYMNKKRAYEKYKEWRDSSLIDEKTKEELRNIKENDKEIRDRFYKELEFGTAGLRGIVGAGTNRMNKYTVASATQGVAEYIISKKLDKKPVVIAYDVRNMSKEFAEITARCFAANGIKTYVFKSIMPVPMLSFSTRILGAVAGIMITASHNPPEYNGYKLFWSNGSQIVGNLADEIIEKVKSVNDFSKIRMISIEKTKEKKLYIELGNALSEEFMNNVISFAINNEGIKEEKENIKIVYSPIHGTGIVHIPELFKRLGYKNVHIVPEQELPNEYFPTVEKPNPEEKDANYMALELAKRIDADYTITTDPDTDRIGIGVRLKKDEYRLLTGNEMGILFVDYLINEKKKRNEISEKDTVISTVVSTRLTKKMVEKNGLNYIDTLTGFKYIGEHINNFEKENDKNFLFGFEESFGYLYGTNARDKDAVSAVMLAAEMCAYYKKNNKNLIDRLEEIYGEYGYHEAFNDQLVLEGEEGQEKIAEIMNVLRESKNTKIGKLNINIMKDFSKSEEYNYIKNEKTKLNLPKSNVIIYELEDNSWCAIRPSGTEPKLKFYAEVVGNDKNEIKTKKEELRKEIDKIKNIADLKNNKKILYTKKS